MHQALKLLLFLGYLSSVFGQQINSTVPDGEVLCPETVVNLTCETRGSQTQEWSSLQYIDDGGSFLAFNGFTDRPGAILPSPVNPKTNATLITNTMEEGVRVLVSQLHIITSASFPNASISCVGSGGRDTTTIQTLGNPEVQGVTANQHSDNTWGCIIVIAWNLPPNLAEEDMLRYLVYVDETRLNDTLPPVAYRVCTCDSYSISVSAINRCNGVSPNSSIIVLDQDLVPLQGRDCGTLTTQPTCPDDKADNKDLVIGSVIPTLFATGFLVSTIVLGVLLFRQCRR